MWGFYSPKIICGLSDLSYFGCLCENNGGMYNISMNSQAFWHPRNIFLEYLKRGHPKSTLKGFSSSFLLLQGKKNPFNNHLWL